MGDLHGKYDLNKKTIISSFDWRVLSACRLIDGASVDGVTSSMPRLIKQLGGQVWAPYFDNIDESAVTKVHELGFLVNVWTVNGPDSVLRLAGMGVDGIITDYPLCTRDVLSFCFLTFTLCFTLILHWAKGVNRCRDICCGFSVFCFV